MSGFNVLNNKIKYYAGNSLPKSGGGGSKAVIVETKYTETKEGELVPILGPTEIRQLYQAFTSGKPTYIKFPNKFESYNYSIVVDAFVSNKSGGTHIYVIFDFYDRLIGEYHCPETGGFTYGQGIDKILLKHDFTQSTKDPDEILKWHPQKDFLTIIDKSLLGKFLQDKTITADKISNDATTLFDYEYSNGETSTEKTLIGE